MNKILIHQFGPICEAEIDLDKKMQVFIGTQASGKSTACKVIYYCQKIRDYTLEFLMDGAQYTDNHKNEYFNNYNTNSYLIFILNSGSVDSKKKLYKLINDNGTFNKLSVTEEYLDTFVRNYIKDNGFTMSDMDF